MTPEVARAWMDILTDGKGLLIVGVIFIMLAGIGLSLIVGIFLAWKLGVMSAIRKDIVEKNRENRILELMLKICEKAGYKVDESTGNIPNP